VELLGRNVLLAASKRNAPIRKWLEIWAEKVAGAAWYSLHDVRQDYPATNGVRLKTDVVITVFYVKGNIYRLLTAIDFELQTVVALEVLTHVEYSKNMWKARN